MSNALLQAGHIEERCRRHLFQVSNKLKNAEITIEDIGDYLPASVMVQDFDYINKHYTAFCKLTRREKEIIGLIATGKSCSEISDLLFISLHTVHNHRKNINKKLEISSIHNLIKFARAFDL